MGRLRGESYDGHFLHILSTFILEPEEGFAILLNLTAGEERKVLLFSHGSEASVLDMAASCRLAPVSRLMSTAHVDSGLTSHTQDLTLRTSHTQDFFSLHQGIQPQRQWL